MAQIATPMDLVDMKYARDMANLRVRQQRIVQEQHARQEVARQQQLQSQHLQAAQQVQQQAMRNGNVPNGRVGPIPGQGAVPNMVTPSQQQILSAVAAANAVHSRQGSANNGQAGNSSSPSIRNQPTPQQQAQQLSTGPVLSTAAQSAHLNQQIAHLTAQTMSAQQAQAQAQAQALQANAHARAQSNPNSTNPA
jgi:chromatin modification-related protein VID21